MMENQANVMTVECEGCGSLFMAKVHTMETDKRRLYYIETYCKRCEDMHASQFPGIPVRKLREENKRYDGVEL